MREDRSSNTSKALRGMSSQTLVTIVLGVVEIVSFSIMSRLLTAKDFGYYAALSAILVVFNSLAETGIGAAIIQRKDADKHFINNAFTLSFLVGSIISISLFLLSDILASLVVDESMTTPLRLMSLTILCYCMTSPYISILYKRLQFLTVGMINLISLVITTIIAIVLASGGYGYYAIIAKTVISSILTLLGAAMLSKIRFSFSWDFSVIKSIWKFSGWLMASVVFRNFAQQCDRILMSRLLSVEALGAYNRPKEFINQISSKLNGIFDTALFPVLSGIQDNLPSLQRAFRKSLYLMNLFSIMMAIAFFYNAELIIRIFFGIEWLDLVSIFQLLSVALIFNIDGRLADCYLRSLALTKSQFYFRVIETILKFGGIIFAVRYGLYGIAVAVILSNFIMVFVKLLYIARHLYVNFGSVFNTIFKAWQPLVFLIPILSIVSVVYSNTLINNMITLISFIVLTLIIFVMVPTLAGRDYKDEVYSKVRGIINQKLNRRNNNS